MDWTDKTDHPPTPLFKGEVRLDDKKKKKERRVAETMVKADKIKSWLAQRALWIDEQIDNL